MFDIAWSEFLVVAVVALVVVGPRDLPALLRTVGKAIAQVRRMAGEFQSQFNDAMREAELDDLKREVTGLKDVATRSIGKNPFQIARDELASALKDKPLDAPSALSGEAPKPASAAGSEAAEIPSAFAPPPPDETPAPTPAELQPPSKTNGAAPPTPEAEAVESPRPTPPGAAA